MDKILVQREDFNFADEYQRLSENSAVGAVVTFVGKVRDYNLGDNVVGLRLEHYPQMTESALQQIATQARERWFLDKITIIHRVGDLNISEQIVLVGVSSAHRDVAFASCAFIMDYLKTEAPFWKKERLNEGSRWLDARQSDKKAQARWEE